jgi:hypothetical protein
MISDGAYKIAPARSELLSFPVRIAEGRVVFGKASSWLKNARGTTLGVAFSFLAI